MLAVKYSLLFQLSCAAAIPFTWHMADQVIGGKNKIIRLKIQTSFELNFLKLDASGEKKKKERGVKHSSSLIPFDSYLFGANASAVLSNEFLVFSTYGHTV